MVVTTVGLPLLSLAKTGTASLVMMVLLILVENGLSWDLARSAAGRDIWAL